MESCKAGLENRINAKEAQETLKMPRKTCHDALELGNQARFWVGWVQSQVTKHQTFEARNVAFIERTCHFIGYKYQFFIPQYCASEYLQHSALCWERILKAF